MLELTVIGSHNHVAIVKHLVKFATALMCSCISSSQMVYWVTINSSVVLGFD